MDKNSKSAFDIISLSIGAINKEANSFNKLLKLIKSFKSKITSVKDDIYFENFIYFIMHTYQYDEQKEEFINEKVKSLSIALAEASPNYEAGYDGNEIKLREYTKRLLKIIDECGTIQKTIYISNLSRAIISGSINTDDYFKLCRCVISLTEEDLKYLSNDIEQKTILSNNEHIDDFLSVGIIYQIDKGYTYNKRAFELKKNALCYEDNISIPDNYPERYKPQIVSVKDGALKIE